MSQLNRIALFVDVVDSGALRRAAERRGLSASAVSQQLRALEQQLGVTLLHRSTRRLTLSAAGERFYQHARRMVQAAQDAEQAMQAFRGELSGPLRITAPVGLAGMPLAQALAPLLDAHPGLQLQLLATDTPLDLVAERVDVALRIGALAPSRLIAHPLPSLRFALAAAPAYLARYGTPAEPEALATHHWVRVSAADGQPPPLLLEHRSGRQYRAPGLARVVSTNLSVALDYVFAGVGIGLLPLHLLRTPLRNGTLQPVLPDWAPPAQPLHALTLERQLPLRTRAALDALQHGLTLDG